MKSISCVTYNKKNKIKTKYKQTKKKPDYKLVHVYILLQKFNKDGFRENAHKKKHIIIGWQVTWCFFYLSV